MTSPEVNHEPPTPSAPKAFILFGLITISMWHRSRAIGQVRHHSAHGAA